jgi:hypothetical protein
MYHNIIKIGLLAVVMGLTGVLSELYGQQGERRFSITLHSGYTYGSDGQGMMGRMAGNFNVESHRRPVFGAGLQYAVTPAWSVEGAFHTGEFANQFDADPYYHTIFTGLNLRVIGNMNNLFNFTGGVARFLNPYFSLGVGGLHSNVEAEDLNTQDISLSLAGGLGLSIYVNRWVDLFAQYDYHVVGGDLLDGVSGPGGSDQFAMAHGGIRINFGRGNTRLASWPDPAAPYYDMAAEESLAVNKPEPEPEVQAAESASGSGTVSSGDRFDEPFRTWWAGFEQFLDGPLMTRPEYLDQMHTRIAARAEQLRLEQRRMETVAASMLVDNPPAGQYTQILSINDRDRAFEKRNEAIVNLRGVVMNPSERVYITPFGEYYRILVGQFEHRLDAQRIRNHIAGVYRDAFLITYPRP